MEDELKWEWDISKVSVILRGFGTFSLSFHVSELMRNSEIEFVQGKCTDLVTLIHLEWPFGRSRAGKWQCEGYFTIYPEHPNTDAQARNMVLPMPPTQHRQRNNILQELAKNRSWASSLTCALLSAQKGPEEGREGGSRACRAQELPVAPSVGLGLAVGACELENRWKYGRPWTFRAGLGQPCGLLPLLMPQLGELSSFQALHDRHYFLQRGFPECCCVPHTPRGAPSSLPARRRWISPGWSLCSVCFATGGAVPSWASGTALPDPASALQPILLFFPLALCPFPWGTLTLLVKETLYAWAYPY